jgi:hypothetical protein
MGVILSANSSTADTLKSDAGMSPQLRELSIGAGAAVSGDRIVR